MEYNNRVFIIGAGFSKALANGPLASELLFEIDKASRENPKFITGSGSYYNDRIHFIKIINHIKKIIKNGCANLSDVDITNLDDEGIIKSTNIELLCTILDLNINSAFIPKGKKVDLQGCPIPYLEGFYDLELKGALKFIKHHIIKLLLPERLSPKQDLLDKILTCIKPGDTIITFNYDLLIEQELWKRKLWNPFEGYGIKFPEPERKGNIPENQIQILKLHGSINWVPKTRDSFTFPFKHFGLSYKHPFGNTYYFDNLISRDDDKMAKREYYPLDSYLIYPTYIKYFEERWQYEIMSKAIDSLSKAKMIFILGYSFPEADSISNMLLTQISNSTKIYIIVKGDAIKISGRLKEMFDLTHIIAENSTIEDWIRSDFEFKEFRKNIEKKAKLLCRMERSCKLNKTNSR